MKEERFLHFLVSGYLKITNSRDSRHKFSTCAWFTPHSCSSPTSHSHTVLSEQDHGRVLFSFALSTLTSKLFSPNSCLLLVQVSMLGTALHPGYRAGHKIIMLTLTMFGKSHPGLPWRNRLLWGTAQMSGSLQPHQNGHFKLIVMLRIEASQLPSILPHPSQTWGG